MGNRIFIPVIIILFSSASPLATMEQAAASLVTADQAQRLPQNTRLIIRGNIIFSLGTERYLLRDATGDMVIRVPEEKWEGISAGPFDRVEIMGELRRDDRYSYYIEVEVSNLRVVINPPERGAAELQFLFIWPVTGRVSSPYGNRRSPFTGRQQFHTGIDIVVPAGTPVRAAMSGRVSRVGFDSVYGNFVLINHHSGLQTLYAHLNIARVRLGDYVATGDRVGDVGSTGLSTGPHLHFGVFRNGSTINPREHLR